MGLAHSWILFWRIQTVLTLAVLPRKPVLVGLCVFTCNASAGRRYLLLEFPCLTVTNPPQHFLEIGCGCGSSLLPVLKANPTCSVTGSDLSPTAVQMFKQAAAKAGIAADRVTGYAADSTLMEVADAAADATQGVLHAYADFSSPMSCSH